MVGINPMFSYIRLERGGKRPVDNWRGCTRPDMADVRSWIDAGHNLGIQTSRASGIFVVDVDVDRETMKASEEWRALIAEHGVPQTKMVRTASGGIHLYFRQPADFTVKNDQGLAICRGVDIRGEGGYVVAEGSTAFSSHTNTIGEYVAFNDLPITQAPEWILDKLRKREEVKAERETRAVKVQMNVAPKSAKAGDKWDQLARDELNLLASLAHQLTALAPGARMDLFGAKRGWEDGNGFYLIACRMVEISRWPYTTVTTEQVFDVWRRTVPPHYRVHTWEYALDAAEASWEYGDRQREADSADALFGF